MFQNTACSAAPSLLDPDTLHRLLTASGSAGQKPVLLCIGTDRIIGDCLGPLVGTMLDRALTLPVYGTLQSTVNALNLQKINREIKKKHPDRAVIAVDASLGTKEHIGSVFIRSGSIKPGSGIAKNLPRSGHIAITGVVGAQSSHPYLDLQTVQLSFVMSMAEQIADCIIHSLETVL